MADQHRKASGDFSRAARTKVTFEIGEWMVGGGFYVRATLSGGTVERIDGFATEERAGRWIEYESVAWLRSKTPENKEGAN
jgi:hypothetical protein